MGWGQVVKGVCNLLLSRLCDRYSIRRLSFDSLSQTY